MGGATTVGLRGSYGVVGPSLGEKQHRELVDEDDLTEEQKEALEADEFIIYGKASVERYDEDTPPQKLDMKSFEDQIESFLEDGVISRRHKDIKVGEPLGSYRLEEPTEMEIDGDVYSYDEGEELRTGVRDDELWIVANIKSDSEFARDTRVGALNGALDGFSVTVFCKEWETTSKGQYVTDFDWHSVTIGSDEQIKNPGSRFDFVTFKGEFDLDPQDQEAVLKMLASVETPPMSEETDTDEKGFWGQLRDLASQKAEDEGSTDAPTDEKSEEASDEPSEEKGDYEEDEIDEMGDEKSDYERTLEQVKEEVGEDAAETIKKQMETAKEDVPPEFQEEMEDDGEDEEEDLEEGELKSIADKLAEEAGFVREGSLDEKLDERLEEKLEGFVHTDTLEEKLNEALPDGEVATKEQVDAVSEAAEKAITEAVPDIVEGTAEKMETAGTPSPSQGTAEDQIDYQDEIQDRFASAGGD